MKEIKERKKDIKEKLFNDLFVERYDTFKNSVILINKVFESFNINYQYTYNTFCKDFAEEIMEFMDQNPNVDISEYDKIFVFTPIILMSLINKIKDEHGFKEVVKKN